MKQNYSVLITGFCSVLVIDAESEEEAVDFATEQVSYGDFQMDEAKVERTVPPEDMEAARRHADFISEDV